MAAPARRSAADLIINPAFSDVTILQFDGDKVCHEYRAHNAVLCMDSEFFHEKFTGAYKERDDIKAWGDNKQHFKLLLKYIYTNYYDTNEIVKLAANDTTQCILIPMGICVVADRFKVPAIYELASNDVRALLIDDKTETFELVRTVIAKYYGEGSEVDTPMGKLIVSIVLEVQRKFSESASYEEMMRAYPTFAVGMALAFARNTINKRCHECSADLTLQSDTQEKKNKSWAYCNFCQAIVNIQPKA